MLDINLNGRVLVLRSSDANRQSHNGFQWPELGHVSCDDWCSEVVCGHGLHGLLWGVGSQDYLQLEDDSIFQVVAVDPETIVDLDGKVKFPEGEVVFSGDRFEAGNLILEHSPPGSICNFGTATAGYRGTATAGDSGTATAGNFGTATAGYRGTATAGYRGTATAGEEGYIAIKRWNGKRYRWSFAEVDGESILPNITYKLDDRGRFVRCENEVDPSC